MPQVYNKILYTLPPTDTTPPLLVITCKRGPYFTYGQITSNQGQTYPFLIILTHHGQCPTHIHQCSVARPIRIAPNVDPFSTHFLHHLWRFGNKSAANRGHPQLQVLSRLYCVCAHLGPRLQVITNAHTHTQNIFSNILSMIPHKHLLVLLKIQSQSSVVVTAMCMSKRKPFITVHHIPLQNITYIISTEMTDAKSNLISTRRNWELSTLLMIWYPKGLVKNMTTIWSLSFGIYVRKKIKIVIFSYNVPDGVYSSYNN